MFNNKPSPGFKWRPKLGIYTDGVNNTFDKESFEARSYGWWIYFCKIKGKNVFNAYYYSATTSNHQSNLRDLLKRLKIKIDLTVYTRESLSNFKHASLETLYEDLYSSEISLKRARPQYVADIKKNIKSTKETIKAYRALGATFTRKQMSELKRKLVSDDKKRLENMRNERLERKAQRDALKPVVKDLGPIDLGILKDVNDLGEIEVNFKNEVSNEL